MKPRIKKAQLIDTADDYGITYPDFVGKWVCTYKSISGFGDTIEKAVLAMENLCDFHASHCSDPMRFMEAREYINQ